MDSTIELMRYGNAGALAAAAAERLLNLVRLARPAATHFCLAIPGGRIARVFFGCVVELVQRSPGSLDAALFFWGDERCVPPEDAESNYRLAQECLLGPLNVPVARVHRIRGEADPSEAAAEYAARLRRLLPLDAEGIPIFDLVILGMGEDGHIASLFPSALSQRELADQVAYPVRGPKPPPQRITLSYRALTAARELWVLASGAGKEAALEASLKSSGTPLGRLLRARSRSSVFTDLSLQGRSGQSMQLIDL